jgi:Fe-S oxidoreductase/FAD/FMN-containing dehydrogenase
MDEVLEKLKAICGPEHATNELVDRLGYCRDCGPNPGGLPGYITRPESLEEVAAIVKYANEIKHPVFLWGRATTFVDSGVVTDSIVLALDLLNKFEINLADMTVTAQAGAIWHAIDSDLKKLGWELSAPGGGGMFSASVGGTIAYNAVPHGITEYGVTGDHVVALEVVLPDGTIVHTGSSSNDANGNIAIERGANGPDLTGLFIGSCGTLGVITKATMRIRRIPEKEEFVFYAFDELAQANNAVSGMQSQEAATFIIGLYGGPKPTGISGNYFLHMIIRDTEIQANARKKTCQTICETFHGREADSNATRLYWENHMYSWLRNDSPNTYYGSRPYYCPEVAGFVRTQDLNEVIPALNKYIADTKAEWDGHGMVVKGFDVYFSRNGGFLWVDTLAREDIPESHRYGLKVRKDVSELLFNKWMSPGGIVAGIAPYIMEKLGTSFDLMKALKKTMDPNNIMNPGVLMLGALPCTGIIPELADIKGLALERVADTLFQCLRCGFCFDLSWVGPYHMCPSYLAGSLETHVARGRIALARAIAEGQLEYNEVVAERIFDCTMCGSCSAHCMKQIDIRSIYQAMREDLNERGFTPKGLKKAAADTVAQKNPYAQPDGDRFAWLKDKSKLDRKAPVALFVGCTPSYVRKSVAQEAVELLDKLGIDYTIASQEWCCAHPFMAAGERKLAKEFMQHNIETYKALGVEEIVFVCPGCYETFKRETPEVLEEALPFTTAHIVELVADEIISGRVEMGGYAGATLTYHDPCTLGRQLGVYDAPREILSSIPGIHFIELPRNREDAFCCGAGSFVRYDYPEMTEKAGLDRMDEIIKTDANVLVTTCSSCLSQFQQLRAQTKVKLEVIDLITLVNKIIKVKETIG